jgi:hypothetical protein
VNLNVTKAAHHGQKSRYRDISVDAFFLTIPLQHHDTGLENNSTVDGWRSRDYAECILCTVEPQDVA